MRSKIYVCQPETVLLIAFSWSDAVKQWTLTKSALNQLLFKHFVNDIQSKRGDQQDGFLAGTYKSRYALSFDSSKTGRFWFSLRASSGPFGWIFDREDDKKRESFGLSAGSFESGTLQFSRENRSGPGAVQKNWFRPCPSIKRTANSKSFKTKWLKIPLLRQKDDNLP